MRGSQHDCDYLAGAIKTMGLSPRVRGSHADDTALRRLILKVYPHVCGAASTKTQIRVDDVQKGLSPRVRGSRGV